MSYGKNAACGCKAIQKSPLGRPHSFFVSALMPSRLSSRTCLTRGTSGYWWLYLARRSGLFIPCVKNKKCHCYIKARVCEGHFDGCPTPTPAIRIVITTKALQHSQFVSH